VNPNELERLYKNLYLPAGKGRQQIQKGLKSQTASKTIQNTKTNSSGLEEPKRVESTFRPQKRLGDP
jgi:hypothetical protein